MTQHVIPSKLGVIENSENHLIPFTLIMTQRVFHFAFPHCAHRENNGPRNISSPGLRIGCLGDFF